MFVIYNKHAEGYYTGETTTRLCDDIKMIELDFCDETKDARQFHTKHKAQDWIDSRLSKMLKENSVEIVNTLTPKVLPETKPATCIVCETPLGIPGGMEGTEMCGPCCTGEADALSEKGETW